MALWDFCLFIARCLCFGADGKLEGADHAGDAFLKEPVLALYYPYDIR